MPTQDDEPQMTVIAAPANYPDTTAGPVRYAPVAVAGRVVAYLWAAVDNDGAGVIHRLDVGPDGFNTAVAWVDRLRASYAAGQAPLTAFADWCQHGAEGSTVGAAEQAPNLASVYAVAGRDLDAEQQDQAAALAARLASQDRGRAARAAFLKVQAAARGEPAPAADPELERQIRLLDEALQVHPVPKDLWVWWPTEAGTFAHELAELAGTVHTEPGYLTVALVHYDALADAEALVRLRVPAGVPGIYLNLFDEGKRLHAPTLLLARGRSLAIHTVTRRGGQWRIEAEILPHARTV